MSPFSQAKNVAAFSNSGSYLKAPSWRWYDCLVNPSGEAWCNEYKRCRRTHLHLDCWLGLMTMLQRLRSACRTARAGRSRAWSRPEQGPSRQVAETSDLATRFSCQPCQRSADYWPIVPRHRARVAATAAVSGVGRCESFALAMGGRRAQRRRPGDHDPLILRDCKGYTNKSV